MRPETAGTPGADKRSVLIVAVLASFLTPFMGSSVNIALPAIQKQFSMDAVLLSWVATAYILASAVFLVPSGRLADIHGRKLIFLWGTVIFTLATFMNSLAFSAAMLIAGRVIQGAGMAMVFATAMAMVTSVFPPGERGRAFGLNLAAVYGGLAVGPFLGGVLTQHFGWRSIFAVNIPLGLIIIILILKRIKAEWAEARGERFDLSGTLIYGLALIAVMYGFSQLPRSWALGLIIAGAAGLALFVFWELRVKSPVFDVSLFAANRVFAFSNLAALINYAATYGVTFMLSLYLQFVKGLSPQTAGLVLVTQPVIMTACSPVAGRLSDRVEPQVIASIGMALSAVGLFLLALVHPQTPVVRIVIDLVILGLGFGLFSSPNTNAIMSSVERRFLGQASGALGTMRLLGQMLSMGLATLVLALYLGRVQITPELYPQFDRSMTVIFTIFGSLCTLGVFASLARGKMDRAAPEGRGG